MGSAATILTNYAVPQPWELSLQMDEQQSTSEGIITSGEQCREVPKNGVVGTACGVAC